MFLTALICFTNNGINAIRITITSPIIDKLQDQPELAPNTGVSKSWKVIKIHDTRSSSRLKSQINGAKIVLTKLLLSLWF